MSNNELKVRTWYDRAIRSWVTQIVDEEGNQIGDASYSGSKSGRDFDIRTAKEMIQKYHVEEKDY